MNTYLYIGNNDTELVLPNGSRQQIALGIDSLCRQHLRHNPPSEYDWETAIITVEDAIAPLRALLPPHSVLHLPDSELRLLADAKRMLHRDALEQTFQRISRYGSAPGLPDNNAFFALLLITREWLHHMDFPFAVLDEPRAA